MRAMDILRFIRTRCSEMMRRLFSRRKKQHRVIALIAFACGIFGLLQEIDAATPFFLRTSNSKKEAIADIPFNRLDVAAKQKVNSVVENTSVFKRMTPQIIDCDPRYYMFLIRHPEVIVSIWQMMDATDMRVTRQGPLEFKADDGEGTVGTMEFLYGDQKVRPRRLHRQFDQTAHPSRLFTGTSLGFHNGQNGAALCSRPTRHVC